MKSAAFNGIIASAISVADYEDQLLRQNSLIHKDWRVFRWTDRQLAEEPETIKDQLALFLEKISDLLDFDDFLPQQKGEIFSLKSHQKDALHSLSQMRAQGKTIALLTHATGTGKTTVAISDAKSMNGRTLYLAHRDRIIKQTRKQFKLKDVLCYVLSPQTRIVSGFLAQEPLIIDQKSCSVPSAPL